MLTRCRFLFLLHRNCPFRMEFQSFRLDLVLCPFVYKRRQRRVSFSSLLPFQVKKINREFIHFSMAVFIFCVPFHIFTFSSDLERALGVERETNGTAGLALSVLCISHFSFHYSYLFIVIFRT